METVTLERNNYDAIMAENRAYKNHEATIAGLNDEIARLNRKVDGYRSWAIICTLILAGLIGMLCLFPTRGA